MLSVDAVMLTAAEAVDGMRRPFVRTFGLTWAGRRLAKASWSAFRDALLDGDGIAVARAVAVDAAHERNVKVMLVARWSAARVEQVVHRAVQNAATIA